MRAARGTSLSQGETGSGAPGSSTPRRARVLLGLVFVLALAADQTTKVLAVRQLADQTPRPLLGEVLQLRLTRNPGAAFSAGTTYTEVISVIAIIALVVVLWLSRRVRSDLWGVGLGLLLAGIAGNLTDRLLREPGPLRGHVVDFLMLPHWPIFNIADVCINAAAVAIVIQAFRGIRLDGTRAPAEDPAENPAGGPA